MNDQIPPQNKSKGQTKPKPVPQAEVRAVVTMRSTAATRATPNVQDSAARDWPIVDLEFLSPGTAPAPKMPLEILPDNLRRLALGFTDARKLPIDYVVGSILAAAAGAIGNRVRLERIDGQREILSVYVINVGPPSCGKSGASAVVQTPLMAIEADMVKAHVAIAGGVNTASLNKVDQQIRERVARRLALEDGLIGAADGTSTEPPGLVLTEFTGAGLLDELRTDNDGRFVLSDEIVGTFAYASANQGQRTRTLLLKGYDGGPHPYRNKTEGKVLIPSVVISMLGATQPARLEVLLDAVHDGIAARIWWFYPDVKPMVAIPTGPGPVIELKSLLTRLVGLEPAGGFGPEYSAVVMLAPETTSLFEAALKRWVQRMKLADETFREILGRAAQYVRRLATIFAIMEHAACGHDSLPDNVGVAAVESAIAFVDLYLLPMAERVLGASQTPRESDAARLARFLACSGNPIVNVRADIHRAAGSPVRAPEAVALAIEELRQRNVIRSIARTEKRLGRPVQAVEINPALFAWAAQAIR